LALPGAEAPIAAGFGTIAMMVADADMPDLPPAEVSPPRAGTRATTIRSPCRRNSAPAIAQRVADDVDLDNMSDFDLVGGEVSPLGAGRPIAIAGMKGRSRTYTLPARNRLGKSAISVAFSDRCDMIVATVVLPHDRPATIEPGVMEFLNSGTVLHWAEVALGI
jgi:hypothetical protein